MPPRLLLGPNDKRRQTLQAAGKLRPPAGTEDVMDQLLADGIEVQGGISGRSVPSQRAKKSMTLKS